MCEIASFAKCLAVCLHRIYSNIQKLVNILRNFVDSSLMYDAYCWGWGGRVGVNSNINLDHLSKLVSAED